MNAHVAAPHAYPPPPNPFPIMHSLSIYVSLSLSHFSLSLSLFLCSLRRRIFWHVSNPAPAGANTNPELMPFEYSWTWNAPLRHLVYQKLHGSGVIEPGTGAAAPQHPRRAQGDRNPGDDDSDAAGTGTSTDTPCGCGCHDDAWLRAASAAAAAPSTIFPYPDQLVAAQL